jgi:hypothetical protein
MKKIIMVLMLTIASITHADNRHNNGRGHDDCRFNASNCATTSVPEPSSFALLAVGIVGLVVSKRRRKP